MASKIRILALTILAATLLAPCEMLASPSGDTDKPTPLGHWGYYIADDYDDSTWSLHLEISQSHTKIAVHCEWNGQVDNSELEVESTVSERELIYKADAKAKGEKGCDFEVYAGATQFEVTNYSLIFLDQQGIPTLVFYRLK